MSITFDKRNKRWRYTFRKVIDGQRITKSKLLPAGWTKSQADAYDRQETAKLFSTATGVTVQERTLDEAVKVYLQDKTLKARSSAENHLLACLDWYEGRKMAELPDVIRAYGRDNPHLSNATIRNRAAYLRAAARYAWKHYSYSASDPAQKVVVPKVNNARQTFIDRRVVLLLSRDIQNKAARIASRVAFYSGMRASEILRADIEGDTFVLRDTKNSTPRRIPIHPKIAFVKRIWPLKVSVWHLSKAFKRSALAHGYNDLKFHDLRHSAASAMINAGVDLYTVGGVLGHKSAVSTKRYAHLATESLAAAVNRIGR